MTPMPTGFYKRRRAENGFKLESSHKYGETSREWLTWYEKAHGDKVRHQYNNGREFRVGARNLPVDGYAKATNTVLQFHG